MDQLLATAVDAHTVEVLRTFHAALVTQGTRPDHATATLPSLSLPTLSQPSSAGARPASVLPLGDDVTLNISVDIRSGALTVDTAGAAVTGTLRRMCARVRATAIRNGEAMAHEPMGVRLHVARTQCRGRGGGRG